MSEIKVRGPKGCAKTISHAGKTYEADKRGVFSVPRDFAEHLQRHGFERVPDADAGNGDHP